MTPDEHNPTPPVIHRITPNNPPQFPCWLWCSKDSVWQHAAIQPEGRFAKSLANEYTHWSKERPTVTPDAPTPPAPTLPPAVSGSVRLAVATAAKNTPEGDRVAIVMEVLAALAHLWPRPAAVTADARELANKCLDAYNGAPLMSDIVAPVAAVLAPVVQEIARLKALKGDGPWIAFDARIQELTRRAEAAKRDAAKAKAAFDERDAEHFAVQVALNASDAPASGSQADQVRTLQAMLEAAEAKLAEAVRERDQLRAEVERLRGPSQGTALKYILTRKDGKPIPETARFFVLRLDNHGKKETAAAQAAVLHYAQSVLPIDPDASAAAYRVLRNLPPESTIQPAAPDNHFCPSCGHGPLLSWERAGDGCCKCKETQPITLTEADVESAIRAFVCACRPELAVGWIIDVRVRLLGGAASATAWRSPNRQFINPKT